jgi:hypothetical protein
VLKLANSIAILYSARGAGMSSPVKITRDLGNIGSLGQAGIRALALAPSVMASASGGAQDMGGLPGAIANAATADFRGPFAGMTGRDVLLKTMGAIYGPAVTAWASSQLGPMDDPIRLMAQRAIQNPGGF